MKHQPIQHRLAALILPGLMLLFSLSLLAQNPKVMLFKEAADAKIEADKVQARIYSPDQYEDALKYFEEADKDFQKGKNRSDIEKKIHMSAVYFQKAIATTELVHSQLTDCVKARNDALTVDSPTYRPKEWQDAEKKFTKAVKELEEGDLSSAKSKARDAEEEYREVELEAIKANYLDDTNAQLKEGFDSDVKKKAPITLNKSRALTEEAEQLLIVNRYDTDQVRLLAKEAQYEVKHAFYLTKKIKEIDDTDQTMEQVLLDAEAPLQQIADKLDVKVGFEQGLQKPANDILQEIIKLQSEIANLKQDVEDKNGQIKVLSENLAQLQSKEETLAKIMEQQKLQREKYAKVEKLFTPEEAQVSRMGEQVIIRLYGLSFPVGKSTIESRYFGLLSKVIDAFNEYPGCTVTVEGHTDSYGTDAANMKLSTDRASAVQEYLLATANMDASRIKAVGYGESKPIASNETREGRRKNRRIDIVIHP